MTTLFAAATLDQASIQLTSAMSSPFQEAYHKLDPQLQEALSQDGIYDTPSSAKQYQLLWEQSRTNPQNQPQDPVDESFFDQIADSIGIAQGKFGNHKRKSDITPETQLKRLYTASVATTQWESPIGMRAHKQQATDSLLTNAETISHPS